MFAVFAVLFGFVNFRLDLGLLMLGLLLGVSVVLFLLGVLCFFEVFACCWVNCLLGLVVLIAFADLFCWFDFAILVFVLILWLIVVF